MVGVAVTVTVTVVVGVRGNGVFGAAISDRTRRNPATRTPNATGATMVRGNPAAVAPGRAGALLRPSRTLRLRGAVAAPVGYSAAGAWSSRVVSTSDSMVRVERGDSWRERAMPATIDDAVVLAGNSANAASIAIENARHDVKRSSGFLASALWSTATRPSGNPWDCTGKSGGVFWACATMSSGVLPMKGTSPANIS